MGIDPAFDRTWLLPQPYSKMLTLPMVHPVPRKLAGHPWPAHAFFYKESSTASSSELNLSIFN
jgi:hypothetical protein